jgi:hypothetical protein
MAERSFGGDAVKDMAGARGDSSNLNQVISSDTSGSFKKLKMLKVTSCSTLFRAPADSKPWFFPATQEEEARKAHPRAGSRLTREMMLQLGAADLERVTGGGG